MPWRDWSEWDRVRSGLCGDDPEARDASIARVADWRRRGRVPHAVDCTASLLETRALDAGVPGNVTGASPRLSAPLSENMLRLAYAAALVRMVNGAVDPSQKGKYAAPVMTLAKRMGIPAVLVDVRMAASHQEMPALALLRHASERALQWLFERYWHAQANQLRELRRGAALAAEALVAAEAARRVKAERNISFRKAERGKGKAKTRARNGGVHVEDDDEDSESDDDDDDDDDANEDADDDDSSGGENDAKDEAGRLPQSPRRARRSATNRLFAAVSREDTETCAEALLSVAVGVCRSPDGEPQGSNPTLGDWRAIAARLLKRWPTLDEALLLKAAEAALDPGSPSETAADSDTRDALARAATAATDLFAETSTNTTAPPPKKKRARENENVAKEKSDVDARREKTHWYLTRRALAHATASARMTDALRAFVENLVNTAPGAGRSFKAAAARLLGDGAIKKDSKVHLENENGQKETLASATDEVGGEADDDDAFLAAARRGLAKKRRNAPLGGEDRGGFSREGAAASGVFAKVSDWTPCAVGDLPAHLRRDLGSRRVDAEDALRLAVARAALSDADAAKAGRRKNKRTADLLWARWPSATRATPSGGFAGFGLEPAPETDYAVGAPFADETRRALAGPGPDSRDARDYVPDEAVAAAGEMASGRFLCGIFENGPEAPRDAIDSTPARVSARRAASLVFVDPDDDSDTEPMAASPTPTPTDVPLFTNSGGSGEEENEENEETEDDKDDDASGDETDRPTDGGVDVRVGGVRVRLSASDRNAVAADVECLM